MNDSGCLATRDPMESRANLPAFLRLSALTGPDTHHMAPRNHRDILRVVQTGSSGKTCCNRLHQPKQEGRTRDFIEGRLLEGSYPEKL